MRDYGLYAAVQIGGNAGEGGEVSRGRRGERGRAAIKLTSSMPPQGACDSQRLHLGGT